MIRKQMSPNWSPQRNVYERLSKRLDDFAEGEARFSNAEIIRRMREALFADVDALEKSGTIILPKP